VNKENRTKPDTARKWHARQWGHNHASQSHPLREESWKKERFPSEGVESSPRFSPAETGKRWVAVFVSKKGGKNAGD
jgi:hypothetical protein